jgi:hypothetical protein
MMREAATSAGFRVRKVSYSNALILVPAVLVRIAKSLLLKVAMRKGAASEPGSDFIEVPRPLNAALVRYYKVEAAWLRRGGLPFGLSVVCVADKRSR